MEQVRIGLLGLGTVGTGVYKMLKQNQDRILQETGATFELVSILVKDLHKPRQVAAQELLTDDFAHLLSEQVNVVVEAMGGLEPARSYIEQALQQGCHVISANKELIAKQGLELEQLARAKGVHFLYEASVAGGIPVLGTLSHLLKANRIRKVSGILNGTSNYILTEMSEHGREFAEVLKEAQEKGYAEQDPSADVEGWDAVHKLAILSRLALGAQVQVEEITRQGIADITPEELSLSTSFGYSIKLLAQVEQFGEQGPVSCSVQPTLVSHQHSLAGVQGVYNAVYIEGDPVQDVTLIGQGAGEQPTGSAMVEDLTNITRHQITRGRSIYQPFIIDKEAESHHRFLLLVPTEQPTDARLSYWKERCEQVGLVVQNIGRSGSMIACLVSSYESEKEKRLKYHAGTKLRRLHSRPILDTVEVQTEQTVPVAFN